MGKRKGARRGGGVEHEVGAEELGMADRRGRDEVEDVGEAHEQGRIRVRPRQREDGERPRRRATPAGEEHDGGEDGGRRSRAAGEAAMAREREMAWDREELGGGRSCGGRRGQEKKEDKGRKKKGRKEKREREKG